MCWPSRVRTVVGQAPLSPFGEFSEFKSTRLERFKKVTKVTPVRNTRNDDERLSCPELHQQVDSRLDTELPYRPL